MQLLLDPPFVPGVIIEGNMGTTTDQIAVKSPLFCVSMSEGGLSRM